MEVTPDISNLTPDLSVMAVAWVKGQPISAPCKVHSQAPLYLKTSDKNLISQSFPLSGTLLWEEEGVVFRADAHFSDIQEWAAGFLVEVKGVVAQTLDRRRHRRYSINGSAAIRVVDDSFGTLTMTQVHGRILNISEGGAQVQVEPVPVVGTLLEFNSKNDLGETVRSLGVVIKAGEDNEGIAFVETQSESKDNLSRWIKNVA